MNVPTPTFARPTSRWQRFRAAGGIGAVAVAGLFFAAVTSILMLRQGVVDYRPGQVLQHDLTARVDFDFADPDELARLREQARQQEPRVYRPVSSDYWGGLADQLLALPADEAVVKKYVGSLRDQLTVNGNPPVILLAGQRSEELNHSSEQYSFVREITLYPAKKVNVESDTLAAGAELPEQVTAELRTLAAAVPGPYRWTFVELAANYLRSHPTHELDLAATQAARERAALSVLPSDAVEHYTHDAVIVPTGEIAERDWQLLKAENQAYLASESNAWGRELGGTALMVFALTVLLAAYARHYQPRIIRNHLRAAALAALMAAMLLVSGLAGAGSSPLYFYGFGIAPTILTGMILVIAYDRRFAIGVGSIQAVMVTWALNQGMGFFIVLLVGLLAACFLLDDVRTRSKLIEVGGAAAIAMMVVTAATNLISLNAADYAIQNALCAGAAGMAAGFIALGILPFVERAFHITTSMTLLELADATHPLLKRLALEAPGTYNHSLQVATLAEAAAESIGANALACRVGAYYHDIGKVKKAEYFVENQQHGGESRHMNLSPHVSLLIILAHVKDGLEMAREYHLPPVLLQFIQQHHGTTLVEYFYKEACRLMGHAAPASAAAENAAAAVGNSAAGPAVSETEYRYPGPKPKTRETAILMMCDCVESACRTLPKYDPASVEKLVRELTMRRLHDGQFDECDLTMRDLVFVQQALMKTLMGIYHGRIAYPQGAAGETPQAPGQRKLA